MEKYLEILPENIVNKIMLYYSHPVADLFKNSKYYEYQRYHPEVIFFHVWNLFHNAPKLEYESDSDDDMFHNAPKIECESDYEIDSDDDDDLWRFRR